MSGRIAELGVGVSGWAVGDPVTVTPLAWCGACPACRSEHSHICHNLDFVGIDSPGSMQGCWTVPAELLVRLPEELTLRHAALVEPTAVAVHDVRRADVRTGEHVVVVGAGPVGLLVALVARTVGADVLVLEPNPNRRATATRIRLSTLDSSRDDVASHIDEWTSGAGAAGAFEVSGSADGVKAATEVLAARGRTQALRHDKERNRSIVERIPAGRWGRPDDLAGATVFPASRASDYIHGTILPVDGGWLGR